MNFLFHLYLSPADDPQALVGNLMGDFVKGRLDDRFPPDIRRGLALHRAIDSFAATNEHFRHSRRRLDDSFGHYRGVLVDLFYDHFLAREWDRYAGQPLPEFLAQCRRAAEEHRHLLPERFNAIVEPLFRDWLPTYGEVGGIDAVLRRMAVRVGRGNPLATGAGELMRLHEELGDDFARFIRDAEKISCG